MNQLDYPAIRSRIPIRHMLELLRYQPVIQRGPQWRGPCPFCFPRVDTAKQLCFSVHVGLDLFQCFRCRRSGNQLDLWVHLSGLTLHSATLDLCHRLNMDPVSLRNTQPPNRH